MVWNTTQSSLYKAVSDYNNEISRKERQSDEEIPADRHSATEIPADRHSDENCDAPKSHSNTTAGCRKCVDCPHCRTHRKVNSSSLAGLNFDKDMLLLLGLILILYENGADSKLIAALAITLLG
ncbi:MAG: hypothetical protein ACI4JS_06825 [Oscillospiraceae bacterium]